ncbi:TAXI family TRAP transporter solute-binding subunit [Nesterenkonia alkaliphila]|uniref:TAXI family TRAP transporter solute-binding subunit n=1 Tax=Nesterenkonia alkaliphila TaxID=1463631 RepID=A0A7K1UK14_9MICC|nr:TAXI family TRAP transporter solute-binding subunit [Nesterenkonia alkaliphila]MVT26828.1 TAXI family TRAP transporter solute-binding subunit [Nesterenkonia alkaliphila]GFZ81738.1 C4-dicarboxylate ABC transporter substrate-binding protein [Nesterenkonia alkaliphila]
MTIRRTLTAMTAVAALTALAACGDDNGDENGEGNGAEAPEPEIGSEEDFVTDLEFTTGGTGGTYFPLGGELSEIFSEHTDANVNYVESGGSGENLGRIMQEQSQLALVQNDTTADAVAGELEALGGEAVENVGWIANLYPEAMHIVVLADSGYESIEDLEGATIAVGDAGSGTRAISDAILEYYEIDYTPEVTDFGTSTDMLADGQIDASMFVAGPPVGALTQLAASNDAQLISLPAEDAEAIAEDHLFDTYDISADSYDFLDEDVTTLSVFAALVASTTQVSEDLAYDITAALFEHGDTVTLDVADNLDVEEALFGIGDIPLHPGAERYYEENDIDLP